jgi:hypothetical protein
MSSARPSFRPDARPVLREATPETWLRLIFAAQAAQTGGVIRRSAAWVEREVGRARFEAEVRARGFHLIEAGGQLVVICSSGPFRVVF